MTATVQDSIEPHAEYGNMTVLRPPTSGLREVRHPTFKQSESMGERLKRIREAHNMTQEQVGAQIETSRESIWRWESGSRKPSEESIKALAAAFNVTPTYLRYGGTGGPQMIPIVGLVGAGTQIIAFEDTAFDEIIAPYGTAPDVEALIVRGSSQEPEFQDGDVILYRRKLQDPELLLRQRCIVWTEDGLCMIKRLRRGSGPGLFDLDSNNAATLVDQRLTTCVKVESVIYR
jgi:transcriptional regulator with XRE-family HTH domain